MTVRFSELRRAPVARKEASMENCDTSAPLTKTIRELGVGDAVKFPIERHGSVKAVVSRLRLEQIRIGWNARVKVDYDNFQVEVRRTK